MTIIGIDLGTSNSAAAVLRGGRPVVIPSAEGVSLGGKAFPSYVAIAADGTMLIGEPARRQAAANPEGTATAFKRQMGTRQKIRLRNREFTPEELSAFLLGKIKRDAEAFLGEPARRQAAANPEGTATAFKRQMGTRQKIGLRGRDFTPEELSAFLLGKIKRDAEAFLGEPVKDAVVTVPAYFDDNQRSATKDAAAIAGLNVVRLVNEPTAASLAYGLDRLSQELRIAVIDFGGGTLDVTIMEFGKGVFEVKATSGDTRLGGTDMNQAIFEHLAQRYREQSGIDVRADRKAAARLLEAAEVAKIELSSGTTSRLSLPYIGAAVGEARHLEMDLTRAEMERVVRPVIERCRRPVEQSLADAGITPAQIDRMVFVGGPTRMPAVRQFFEDLLHRKAEMGVDPMECVAAGAAIQAGVLSGEVKDIVLVDVTPLTLGVETLGGVATPLITRNTPVPVRKSEIFTTAADMQTSVTIHVFQGERPMSGDNASLGEFNLDGLAPAPRGMPKIEVSFDIDANGILNVAARDTATGRAQSIRVSGSTRLPQDVRKRMIEEAERYAESDRKRREDADALNAADSMCYQAEKTVADFGDKLTDELKGRIEAARRDTREALAKKDAATAREMSEKLGKLLKEAGAVVYAQQPDAGVFRETKVPSGARVVDADYRETR